MKKNVFSSVGKGVFTVMAAGLLIFSQSNVSSAALITKKVETEPNIKIINNGVTLTGNISPIIIDGTTYVPVRSLGNVVGKIVQWNGPERSIVLLDRADPEKTAMWNEIKEKDERIKELQNDVFMKDAKITELESSIKSKDARISELERQLDRAKRVSLDDLEEELNDDYGRWNGMRFDINLSGNSNRINVEIELDLERYEDQWEKTLSSKLKALARDIADDIWDVYEDARIIGEIIDVSDDDEELFEFTGNNGRVSF